MAQPVTEADQMQLMFRAAKRIRGAGKFERDGDIFQRRHGRDQMEGLEDNADPGTPELGELILVQRAKLLPINLDRA